MRAETSAGAALVEEALVEEALLEQPPAGEASAERASVEKAPPSAPARKRARRDPVEREAQRVLGRAYRVMKQMRLLYSALAILQGFFTLLLFARAFAADAALDDAPTGVLFAVAATMAAITGLLITAAVRVVREPFAWALVVALLQSVFIVLALASGEVSLVQYLLTVVLWGGLVPLVQVRALMQEHPDLYVARRIRGEQRLRPSDEGESVRGRAKARRAQERARRRTTVIAVGGTLGALALLFVGWKLLNRPPALSEVGPALVADWNRSDVPAVADYWNRPERAESMLQRLLKRQDWDGLPEIERHEWVESHDPPRLVGHTPEGVFEFHWQRIGARWILVGIDPP